MNQKLLVDPLARADEFVLTLRANGMHPDPRAPWFVRPAVFLDENTSLPITVLAGINRRAKS